MIISESIEKVESTRNKNATVDGVSINISLDNVIVDNEKVTVNYTYTATYSKNAGSIKVSGTLEMTETKSLAKKIKTAWEEDKSGRKLPNEYASKLLGTINYIAGSNGTLIAKVMNLSPPLIPPKFNIDLKKRNK